MPKRWECRYSSSEMLYLELRSGEIVTYLDHSPGSVERHSFERVLAGDVDAMIAQLFGASAVDEVKAAIVESAEPPPTKEQLRERRRQEQREKRR